MANALGVAIMCGIIKQCGTLPFPVVEACHDKCFADMPAGSRTSTDVGWDEKVKDLAGRGFTLASVLDFYQRLFEAAVMPSLQPNLSTTNDVVCQAVGNCIH